MSNPDIDPDLIDEAVLALLHLTLHRDSGPGPAWRAWKSFDWGALARLHVKDLILDPVGKAKSVMLQRKDAAAAKRPSTGSSHAGSLAPKTRMETRKQKPPEACSRGSCDVNLG